MSTASAGKLEKSHCNRCTGRTSHHLLYREVDKSEEYIEEGGFVVTWVDTYDLLKCCGCGSIHLRRTSWFSEAPDESEIRYFPPIAARRKPDWLHDIFSPIPKSIMDLLDEIYEALHSGSQRLVAMGIRSVVEAVMVKEVGDHDSFAENLKQLHQKGLVSERDREALAKIIEAGHAVTHREYVPNTDDLKTLLDITEALLATVYVHPQRSAELNKKIPPRRKS